MMDSAQELSKSSKEHNQQLLCNNPSASLSDVKHEDEEPINWKIPSRQVEMEKDDKYHELGSIDEQQQQMMADSPIAKYNKKEPGSVVQVDENSSDNQELSRDVISSSGNETAANAGTSLCNSYSLTDVPRMETKLESGNGSGFVSKVVESKSNYLPAHHHQVMTANFSELTALEKSKTSTPLVIEREHSSVDDEKPSTDEKFDGMMKYKSTLEKDDSLPLSSVAVYRGFNAQLYPC